MTKHERYNRSEKGRARHRRYEDRHPGRNATRVFVGADYVGRTLTPESAAALNQQVKEEFYGR